MGTHSGNGAFLPDPWGGFKLCGMEQGAVLRLENVMIPEKGEYILRINYYAGSRRPLRRPAH